MADGTDIIQEPVADGVLIRPAATVAVRRYTARDRAIFALNNAMNAAEYAQARADATAAGFDPDKLPHRAIA